MIWQVFYEDDGNGEYVVCAFTEEALARAHAAVINASVRAFVPLSEPPTSITTHSAIFFSWLGPLVSETTYWSYDEGYAEALRQSQGTPTVNFWHNLGRAPDEPRPWTVHVDAASREAAVEALESAVSTALGVSWGFRDSAGVHLLPERLAYPERWFEGKPERFAA